MPVQYSKGIAHEHVHCRTKTALFDVSHMGEILITGKHALSFLDFLMTNNISKISNQQAQYTVMCNENGGCVDDLIVHKINDEKFFICVNASNTDKDFEWIKAHAIGEYADVLVKNVSDQYSQIAIQGKDSVKILQKLTKTDLNAIKYYWFCEGEISGEKAIIARTGYTGEDGFEIYIPWNSGAKIWQELIKSGAEFGIEACGLGARDSLRVEMKFPLYGHEIDHSINPIEAGLNWVVKLDKPDFVGKKALQEIKSKKTLKSTVGLKTIGRGIPRQGYLIESLGGNVIGKVTSGTLSPFLKYGIAIALVDKKLSKIGTKLNVIIRDQKIEHEVVETPFYKRNY